MRQVGVVRSGDMVALTQRRQYGVRPSQTQDPSQTAGESVPSNLSGAVGSRTWIGWSPTLDKIAYDKGVAPDHLATSTAVQLPTLLKLRPLKQFTDYLLYWVFSLPTGDPERPGTFFEYAAATTYTLDVSINGRKVTVDARRTP